ncbi:MAG: hypothetical protein AB8F95_20235 [Bacteroidia bacterium]
MAEIDFGALNLTKKDFIDSLKPAEYPPRNHGYSIEFKPMNWNKDLVFGTVYFETEFRKYQINQREFWLPQKWTITGQADSTKTKMVAQPNYEIDFSLDSSVTITQYSFIALGDLDLEVSSSTIRNEEGRIIKSTGSSGIGATASRSILHVFKSHKGELSQLETESYRLGFADEGVSQFLQSIFGSNDEIIGSSMEFFE